MRFLERALMDRHAARRSTPFALSIRSLFLRRWSREIYRQVCPETALGAVAAFSPELMTEPLAETTSGAIARSALDRIRDLAETRTVMAIGPGIGTEDETREVVQTLFGTLKKPMVVDADALNC